MIEQLKRILKQEDTVLFVGSGISLWSDLPTWPGLIQELADFLKARGYDPYLVEQELKRGDLIQAASYGFDKLTKPQIAEFIRQTCRLSTAKPHAIHQKILSLGPNCYITTNYDRLLELSFQQWRSQVYLRKVINRQLTETAEIVGARANNFLFKLHGDAEDSESIILTREQYRALNPGGELSHALETVKILMASRPVVYIGFGLRDPDFIYVKDLLINTYRGGARDHYAIIADISDEEKAYWKKNFGIHILSYNSLLNEDGTKDHSPLLSLLDNLSLQNNRVEEDLKEKTSSLEIGQELILNLARHASKYLFKELDTHIPLVANSVEAYRNQEDYYDYSYSGSAIEDLLDGDLKEFVLTGLPGSGKSYSLKNSVSRFAAALYEKCIKNEVGHKTTVIPIYVDLKLYQGSIIELIEQNIAIGMSLDFLLSNFQVRLYIDAFNEIPREYIETNHWDLDFSTLREKDIKTLILSSRTIDGLDSLEFPVFNLDSIDSIFIQGKIAERNLSIGGVFRNEVFALLQRPFFYKLVFSDGYPIDEKTSPKKIYADILESLNVKFHDKYLVEFDLKQPLSNVALTAVDSGEEAFRTEMLMQSIDEEFLLNGVDHIIPSDVINWLVSQDFLIPIVNERISFFHQSVTEYLAAEKLAIMFAADNSILKEKLRFRRWDQALFLSLSMLNEEESKSFLNTVIDVDFELALSSVKYMEADSTEIVNHLLSNLTNYATDWIRRKRITNSLKNKLPVSEAHAPMLEKIISERGDLGGAAVSRLLDLYGENYIDKALNLILVRWYDISFCESIGEALEKLIKVDKLPELIRIINETSQKSNLGEGYDTVGFSSAMGKLMVNFDPELIYNSLFNPKIAIESQRCHVEILCEVLRDSSHPKRLNVALKLSDYGVTDVATEIYFITAFTKKADELDYSLFEVKHIEFLVGVIRDPSQTESNAQWALGALKNICLKRTDFIGEIEEIIKESSGLLKAGLQYAIANKDYSSLFETLTQLCNMNNDELSHQPFSLLANMDEIDWEGQENLLVKLLKLRNEELTNNLCESISIQEKYLELDIGPIHWWLEWFDDFYKSKETDRTWMFEHRVSDMLANHTSIEKRSEFIAEFNDSKSKYRDVLRRSIIRRMGLTLDDLNDSSISFLLENLKREAEEMWDSILLDISTEKFVLETLIPRLSKVKGVERANLSNLIEDIGRKHNRRYIVND